MMKIEKSMPPIVYLALVLLAGVAAGEEHVDRLLSHPGLEQSRDILQGQPYQDLDFQIRQGDRERQLEAFTKEFTRQHEQWEKLLQAMNQRYAEEIEKARKDADIDKLSQFLRFTSQAVTLVASYQEWRTRQQLRSKKKPGPNAGRDLERRSDGVHVREYYERIERSCKSEDCKIIDMRRVLREKHIPRVDSENLSFNQMDTQVNQLFQHRPPSVICDGTLCLPLTEGKVEELLSIPTTSTMDGGGEIPTPEIFESLSSTYPDSIGKDTGRGPVQAPAAKKIFSVAMDFWGPTAFPKSVVEVVTGRDPVTGEEVGRVVSGVGILVTPIPGGKVLLKRIPPRHVWKTGLRKLGGKWIAKRKLNRIFLNPGKLSGKTPIDVQKDLGILPKDWITTPLGQGGQKNVGGWALREVNKHGKTTGNLIRYHPGGGRHGADPYWIVSSAKYGKSRIPAGTMPAGVQP